MKRNPMKAFAAGLIKKLFPSSIKPGPVLAWAGAFLFCIFVMLATMRSSRSLGGSIEGFAVGMVADRDIVAEQSVSYEDVEATRLRLEAQERLAPAVFRYSQAADDEIRKSWERFAALAGNGARAQSGDVYRLELQSEFPGDFSGDILDIIYQSGDRDAVLAEARTVLDAAREKGVYSMPQTGLESLNPDAVELIRSSGERVELERAPLASVVTRDKLAESLAAHIQAGSYSPLLAGIGPRLLRPFLRENVFYSPEDTALRIADIRAKVEPVMRHVEQGKRVIKKGFIISEEDMAELVALRVTVRRNELPVIFAELLFLILIFGILVYFCGARVAGRNLALNETFLVAGISALYMGGAILARNISLGAMPSAVAVPTALVIMLPSILIHPRLALLLAMALPLGAFLTESFDAASYVFALVSGVVASHSLQGAQKRMDLVKAGLAIASANLMAMIAVLLWQRSPAGVYPQALFWAAFNGVASGMLVLGALPLFENALNAATSFRLIELSDLNAPILRRLFTSAPGTYSHSIMVANLAEAACQDIGANPLLARVGAYYHDLGKLENPDYFVENQTDHNRHDDIAPRLSATVIRSHVKLGVEKARQLGLPRQVIDIIGEHHGNSVIAWFYNKALKMEDAKKSAVNVDDFTYPGEPPRSRESAAVMLADMAEAAVRTLDKPTAGKIEKFLQELIDKKVESGQLAQSELTFRDLETIKNAFVRVLAGYYHSRIEYPKTDAQKNSGDDAKPAEPARDAARDAAQNAAQNAAREAAQK